MQRGGDASGGTDGSDSGGSGGGDRSLSDQADDAIESYCGDFPRLVVEYVRENEKTCVWGSPSGSSFAVRDFSNLRFPLHNATLYEITSEELLQGMQPPPFRVSKIQCRDRRLYSALSSYISSDLDWPRGRFDCGGRYSYVTGMPSKGRAKTAALDLSPLLGPDLSGRVLSVVGVDPGDEAAYEERIGPVDQLLVTWADDKRGVAYARQALGDFIHALGWDGFLGVDDDIRRACKRCGDGAFDVQAEGGQLGAFLVEARSLVHRNEPAPGPSRTVNSPRVAMVGTTIFNGVNGKPLDDYRPRIKVNKFVHRAVYFNLAALRNAKVEYDVEAVETRWRGEDVRHARAAVEKGLLVLKSTGYITVYDNHTNGPGGVNQSEQDAVNAGFVATPGEQCCMGCFVTIMLYISIIAETFLCS